MNNTCRVSLRLPHQNKSCSYLGRVGILTRPDRVFRTQRPHGAHQPSRPLVRLEVAVRVRVSTAVATVTAEAGANLTAWKKRIRNVLPVRDKTHTIKTPSFCAGTSEEVGRRYSRSRSRKSHRLEKKKKKKTCLPISGQKKKNPIAG